MPYTETVAVISMNYVFLNQEVSFTGGWLISLKHKLKLILYLVSDVASNHI